MERLSAPVVAACASAAGGRSENQDRCYASGLDASQSLWGYRGVVVVADGMGGHERGDVAAQLAVDTAREILTAAPGDHGKFDHGFLGEEPEAVVSRVFEVANERIYERAAEDELQGNMGTTMTALVLTADEVVVGHVGDSKAFVVSGGSIRQITEDHSWVAEQVKEGRMTPEEAAGSPFRGHLTQAIGVERTVAPYRGRVRVEPGALLVVCSDGLTEVVDEDAIRRVAATEAGPEQVCQTLVSMAVDGGTRDNVTVAAIAVPSGDAAGAAEAAAEGTSASDDEAMTRVLGDANESETHSATENREGEGTVGGERSRRLAILAAACMFSLVAGLVVGKLLVGSPRQPDGGTEDAVTLSEADETPPPVEQPEQPPEQPAAGPETATQPTDGGEFRIEVTCEGDALFVSSNEPVTYDVYPRGQHGNFDARLLSLEGEAGNEARFGLPEAPPESWHEESVSLTIERLGGGRIRIEPTPEDLEVFVDYHACSGAELEAVEVAGRRARIGFYFPPSRPEGAYAIAVADFDANPDEEAGEEAAEAP